MENYKILKYTFNKIRWGVFKKHNCFPKASLL